MSDIDKLYKECRPDESFIKSIFKYDVRMLEQTDDLTISKFIIGLSQYLIYFKSKYNETKAELTNKQRLLELSVTQLLTPEDIKKHKTKKDARFHLIYSSSVLNKIQIEIDNLHNEVYLLEGIDKTISELIAAFKRELTRRENELYQRRHS